MKLYWSKRWVNLTVRCLVGLSLAGGIALIASQIDADLSSTKYVQAIDGGSIVAGSPAMVKKLGQLAKSDHIALLEWCLKNYDNSVTDYTCSLVKQERLFGQLLPSQEIDVKYIESPFSVAMSWRKNAQKADRAIFIEGKYDGNMLVRPTASWQRMLVGSQVRRPPSGPDARASALRPINMFGFRRGLVNLLKIYRLADNAGELAISFGGYTEVAGRKCIKLIRYLPATDPAYPNKITEIHIDIEHLVPLCVKGIGWDGELICNYVYKDIRFNVGLGDDDFLPENNGM